MSEQQAPDTAAETPSSHEFQAEVSKLLHLMVHSVYSEPEVFLRELVSNAADACDKLRYAAITEPDLLADDPQLAITLTTDKDAGTLTVTDNGIGMSHDELVDNLGTIARSGTKAFMESMAEGKGDIALIGQFGVGFYSAFIVAEKVDVYSKRAGAEEVWHWSSNGTDAFTVEPAEADDYPRGTTIVLKVNENSREFLEAHRLEHIVKTYSDHVALPIRLEENGAEATAEVRQLNTAGALWARPKSEIDADQYKEFYGHVAGAFDDPALTIHYRAEGRNEYTVLLFVPGQPPFDLFDPSRQGRIKLYVRRVYITDDAELLPSYLRFVRGIVDSEDMPLNISREMLQNNPIVAAIRKAVGNRVLSELKKTAEKDADLYKTIWSAFGSVLKEGLYEDMERRDDLLELVRFKSTSSDGETRSLKDYVADMAEKQTAIYYVTGDKEAQIANSPQIEGYKARGLEVLLLTDPVDSFWTTTVLGYDGKPFKSVTQGSADLDSIPAKEDDDDKSEDSKDDVDESAFGTLMAAVKQTLGDQVSEVKRSQRLTTSPVCLVADEKGMDRGLEKILAHRADNSMPSVARVLELNASHEVIKALAERAKSGVTPDLEDAARLLYDQALILEGETVADPAGFSARLSKLMAGA